MKTSLIATVLNEEKAIDPFIRSILSQTKLPDEIVIVDGGSTDATASVISNLKSQISNKQIKFKFIVKKGNRSVGRNEAIRNANGEIILSSDSGCVLDKNWIKDITEHFKDSKVDVVAGYYRGNAKNVFQKCLIPYVLVMPDRVNPQNFLPASRSMAFRKSIWREVGGFPEEFSHNEDYVFAQKLKNARAKTVFNRDAIVYWSPRKNLKDAFIMFFRFAQGDAEAHMLRSKVFLIFIRYLLGMYFLLLTFIMKSTFLLYGDAFIFSLYIGWSIAKNYKYVKDMAAFIFLPILQFTSDIAVLVGTLLGLLRKIEIMDILQVVRNNKAVAILVIFYIATMVMLINWGTPNKNHPFTYFMDEWHQVQAVRTVFTQGSPNVEGSANGSMFHFLLSGILLVPFIATGVVDPFSIQSSIGSLEMQERLFQILRLNTIFFGAISIVLIAYIAKKHFKLNPFLTAFLFVVNPIWLSLSNYFKYDIALIFWILLFLVFILRYGTNPTLLNFCISAFLAGISLSVKLSAIPLLPILIVVFWLFNPKRKKKIMNILLSLLIFFGTFLIFGIPDLILGKGHIYEYIYDNLARTPSYVHNYILGMPYVLYLVIKGAPTVFGYTLFFLSVLGIIFALIDLERNKFENKTKIIILVVALLFFTVSLIPLQIEARGNRLLVLLPFMVFTSVIFINRILVWTHNLVKKAVVGALVVLLFFQSIESLGWVYIKLKSDPRYRSSEWVIENIPSGSVIGLENIPIYQFLPNIVLKEFYTKKQSIDAITRFDYKIVDSLSDNLPPYVVVTNEEVALNYFKRSSKKDLIGRLKEKRYKKIFNSKLDFSVLRLYRDERDYFMSGLVQLPISINIYKK